jgi:hypothetical protein
MSISVDCTIVYYPDNAPSQIKLYHPTSAPVPDHGARTLDAHALPWKEREKTS